MPCGTGWVMGGENGYLTITESAGSICFPVSESRETGTKKAQAVIISVLSFSLAGINLPAVNRLCDRTEIPGDTALTVEFLLSLLAQFLPGNKPGHDHHSFRMAWNDCITGKEPRQETGVYS